MVDNDSKTEPLILSPEEQTKNVGSNVRSTPVQRARTRKMGRIIVICAALFVTVVVAILCYQGNQEDESDERTYFSAAVICLTSCMITANQVYLHLTNWNAPKIQIYYVAIWGMIPVWSICSWLSLRWTNCIIYFESIKEAYEAIVVYSYVALLISIMGGKEATIEAIARKDPKMGEHRYCFPICCGKKWEMGEQYYSKCVYGAKQFMYYMLFHAILILALQPIADYEHDFNFTNLFSITATLGTFSLIWAIYSLFSMETALSEDLTSPKNWNPKWKFVSFKAIVGITTLQSIIIGLLVDAGTIKDIEGWSAEHVGDATENYLIVIEMILAAIVFTFTYSYMELIDDEDEYMQVETDDNLYEINID